MNILFDLDGTLLPLTSGDFENYYYPAIGKHLNTYGHDVKTVMKALEKGIYAMYESHPNKTNYDQFVEIFLANTNFSLANFDDVFNEFYGKDFYNLKSILAKENYSTKLIKSVKGHNLILATNPLFPKRAQHTRIELAGMNENDFSYITMMENSHYLKPNPKYYEEILANNKLAVNEVLMIGNDYKEDYLPCKSLGIRCILVKDFLMNHEGQDLSGIEIYSFQDLEANIEKIITI